MNWRDFKFKIPLFKFTFSTGKPGYKVNIPIVDAFNAYKKGKPMVDQLRDLFIEKCLKLEGQTETDGKNRSPFIDADNKRAGVAMGSPYCLTSSLCRFDEACSELGLKNVVGIHASTQNWYRKVPKQFILKHGKKGCIAIFQSKGDKSRGHAAPVRENMMAGSAYFRTIEFNTDGTGSRDGDGVWKKTRSVDGSHSMRFLGFVDVCAWVEESNK